MHHDGMLLPWDCADHFIMHLQEACAVVLIDGPVGILLSGFRGPWIVLMPLRVEEMHVVPATMVVSGLFYGGVVVGHMLLMDGGHIVVGRWWVK